MFDNYNDFLKWEQATQDTIDVKKVYVDMCQDLVSGVLLSQIVYWNLPNKEGKTKLRVKKDGYLWIAKGREDWWGEIRITDRQFDRAIAILKDKGLVIIDKFKFDGSPTIHIRIVWDRFLSILDEVVNGEIVFTDKTKTKDPRPRKPKKESSKNKGESVLTESVKTDESSNINALSVFTESVNSKLRKVSNENVGKSKIYNIEYDIDNKDISLVPKDISKSSSSSNPIGGHPVDNFEERKKEAIAVAPLDKAISIYESCLTDRKVNQVELKGFETLLTKYSIDIIIFAIEEFFKHGDKDFSYLEGILRNWEHDGLDTVEAVKKHIEIWQEENRRARENKRNRMKSIGNNQQKAGQVLYEDENYIIKPDKSGFSKINKKTGKVSFINSFNNYDQRDYDISELERKLRGIDEEENND
jgi:DnaD/phage-associated family protein